MDKVQYILQPSKLVVWADFERSTRAFGQFGQMQILLSAAIQPAMFQGAGHTLQTKHLCVSANLVKIGPRRGVFLSCIDLLRKTTPRIWRTWLAEKAKISSTSDSALGELQNDRDRTHVIWVDSQRNVGIRVRVRERRWYQGRPVLMYHDEDEAVSYSLELEGTLIKLAVISLSISDEHNGAKIPRCHLPIH